jgi:nitrite reductase/ring-hydroxylating ferredoxin subunit
LTRLTEIGTYTRDLGAGLDRLIENALDWEHLPHVHRSSFASIAPIETGPSSWRAAATLGDGRTVDLSLELDRDAAGWITRTRIAGRIVGEIRSRAEATGADSCRVRVTFHVANLVDDRREATGAYYRRLYAGLYDEDERLMAARAAAIRRGPKALELRRDVVLADGSTHKMPLHCPHQGLPLDAEPDGEGIVTCPWHGYRFDLRTGRSADGKGCRWAI